MELNTDQVDKIALLTSLLSTDQLSPSEQTWLSKGQTYKRYLVANKWNVDTSLERIRDTIQWRRDTKPDSITLNDVFEEAKSGNIYHNGFCREGRFLIS